MFAVYLAVQNIAGDPGDFRRGMAAFHAFDFEVSKRVFAVCGTSTRVFALHEQLGFGGIGEPFYHVVEVPVRGLRRRLRPPTHVRDHARQEQIHRSLARRRQDGVRDPWHLHPRTRSHRVRALDDAADPGRSQSFARRTGHEGAVAPVPCTRSRPGAGLIAERAKDQDGAVRRHAGRRSAACRRFAAGPTPLPRGAVSLSLNGASLAFGPRRGVTSRPDQTSAPDDRSAVLPGVGRHRWMAHAGRAEGSFHRATGAEAALTCSFVATGAKEPGCGLT